jgi:CheY-like chemotaxis protein
MRLLIVEDNAGMRRLLISLISDLIGRVRECTDGSEALSAYREFQPDLVLMDIKMEKVDGIAATQQIRAEFPGARIAIVTDYDDARLREAARLAGACGYVLKENLLAIRALLKRFGVR